MTPVVSTLDAAFVDAFRAGTLTQAQAEAAMPRDHLAATFFLLQLSAAIAGKADAPAGGAHTPSGSIPPYAKRASKRRKKKPGGQPGHAGESRPLPQRIDRRESHSLPACPDCGGELVRTGRTRTRVVEDIPADLKVDATEHTIHRDWCPACKRQVEPRVPDALPHCTLGNRVVTLAAWLHYGLGTTIAQIVSVLGHHLRLTLSAGGLMQMWHRLASVLGPWYEQVHRHCLDAGVLHADETGWRVDGKTWWLWCFATADATFYFLDPSRGHPALDRFFVEEFQGVLVSDFWAAYDAVGRMKQKCWPHLLRDLKEVDDGADGGGDWPAFAKGLRRVYTDAVRLAAARPAMPGQEHELKLARLHGRIIELAMSVWENEHARRLAKRLRKYGDELLTFVECDGVPADNNHAEREIRPAVLMRKASQGNRSERGAHTRAVLMTLYRTLKKRGLEPLQATLDALRSYATTGRLPPLPEKVASRS
jgi:transposase